MGSFSSKGTVNIGKLFDGYYHIDLREIQVPSELEGMFPEWQILKLENDDGLVDIENKNIEVVLNHKDNGNVELTHKTQIYRGRLVAIYHYDDTIKIFHGSFINITKLKQENKELTSELEELRLFKDHVTNYLEMNPDSNIRFE